MSEAVDWLDDATPHSPRFNDVYRSRFGGLEQARQVFLEGCDLPQAWTGQRQWVVLETGFGLGLNFLATWQRWKSDPQRSRLLHFVSVEAYPVAATDIVRSAQGELQNLAQELVQQWNDLGPGVHRLSFDDGRVLLTLCVGDVKPMLRQLDCSADAVFLDGFAPALNPDMWDLYTLKAVSHCCRRGTRLATWTAAREVRDHLAQCGFIVQRVQGLAPKRHAVQAEFNPRWELRRRHPSSPAAWSGAPGRCAVIGAGLAGASVASSLARRGWSVTVLDAGCEPAAGASGLPAGLVVPHTSSDDAVLSRLSRAGVRATWHEVQQRLRVGTDYAQTGVLERQLEHRDAPEHWHAVAGWIKPAQLVRALLAQPNIAWQGHSRVQAFGQGASGWDIVDENQRVLLQADLVVVCAGFGSHPLLNRRLPLHALRGQLSWGWREPHHDANAFPATPVNGHGNFIPEVPTAQGQAWYLGSTFGRDRTDDSPTAADHEENLERLRKLLPRTAQVLNEDFHQNTLQAFTAIRCASPDRLPLVGAVDPLGLPGVYVSTAMGARGLTLALLCGELLAARVHAEPLPVEASLASALELGRRCVTRFTPPQSSPL